MPKLCVERFLEAKNHRQVVGTPNGTSPRAAERPRRIGTPNPGKGRMARQDTRMRKIGSKNDAAGAVERMGSSLPKTPNKKGRILGTPQASHAESTGKGNDPGPGRLRFGFTSSNHPGKRRTGTGNGPDAKEPEDSRSPQMAVGWSPPTLVPIFLGWSKTPWVHLVGFPGTCPFGGLDGSPASNKVRAVSSFDRTDVCAFEGASASSCAPEKRCVGCVGEERCSLLRSCCRRAWWDSTCGGSIVPTCRDRKRVLLIMF
eukprot:scaffold818_cov388-Pavlova_lutheri.AAC.2